MTNPFTPLQDDYEESTTNDPLAPISGTINNERDPSPLSIDTSIVTMLVIKTSIKTRNSDDMKY
jgi:hypothetical protein